MGFSVSSGVLESKGNSRNPLGGPRVLRGLRWSNGSKMGQRATKWVMM